MPLRNLHHGLQSVPQDKPLWRGRVCRKLHSLMPTARQSQTLLASFQEFKLETHSITSGGRKCMNLQESVIWRHWLKCYISMPGIAREFAWLGQWVDNRGSAFLLFHTADNTDLITQLAPSFRDRMDVESWRIGLGDTSEWISFGNRRFDCRGIDTYATC
jgi:hypothetical protein